jgi:hypothetical protein
VVAEAPGERASHVAHAYPRAGLAPARAGREDRFAVGHREHEVSLHAGHPRVGRLERHVPLDGSGEPAFANALDEDPLARLAT